MVGRIGRIKTLFTHHDPGHAHKILGLACLLSFIYRFSKGFHNDDDMGMAPLPLSGASQGEEEDDPLPRRVNYGTLLTIVLHWSLSVSSLVFHIPTKRMEGAWRIWPEYRFHSILFATRNLALMTWTWVQDYYNITRQPYVLGKAMSALQSSSGGSSPSGVAVDDVKDFMFTNTTSSLATFVPTVVLVLSTCWAADVATSKSTTTTTIRGLKAHPMIKYVFSVLQFTATAGCLIVGGNHTYSKHLMMVFVIQVNAFLMTLNRKNVIPQVWSVLFYLTMLIVGSTVATLVMLDDGNFFYLLAFAYSSAFIRIGPLRMNKYYMWLCVSCVMHWTYWTVEQHPGEVVGVGADQQEYLKDSYPKQVVHKLVRQLIREDVATSEIWKPISCCSILTVLCWGLYTIYIRDAGVEKKDSCNSSVSSTTSSSSSSSTIPKKVL